MLVARVSLRIDAPRAWVWDALIDPTTVVRYMPVTEVVSAWRVGASIVWKSEWQDRPFEVTGRIRRFEPRRTLQYEHSLPQFRPGLAQSRPPQLVTIELSDEGSGTRVSVTEDNQMTARELAHAEGGWRLALNGLKSLLEVPYHPTFMPGRLNLYDDRAKRVLAVAQDEAWRVFHHDAIGPEHLLLGVLRCGAGDREGWIVPVLSTLGLDVAHAREALETLRGRGDPRQQLDQIPFTAEGDRVVDGATNEAQALGAEKVTPKHVLLAALREPGTEAILQSLGLSGDAVRQRIIDIPR